MARFVARSNLVKTALFGEDPNWGRILSSAGSSGEDLVPERTDLRFGPCLVLQSGVPVDCDREALLQTVQQKEYKITLDLHLGSSVASAYTCDLSYDYVKINAEYTT
jgi:glutamate N-acetyltransferase/amino-acid N-acetyltransferase